MRRTILVLAIFGAGLALAGCIAGTEASHQAAAGGLVSQLLLGLWHGIIAPVALVIEIINRFMPGVLPWHAQLYETHATGVAYDIGFYVGMAGGPLAASSRWRR